MTDHDVDLDDDPFLRAWTRTRRPPLRPQHVLTARLQHAAALAELDELDAELETLAARRRSCLRRLERLRSRLWPNRSGHHRRRPPIGIPPTPPPPPGAEGLWGPDLRAAAVGILHRHGPSPLREVHALLHRYGYEIRSSRPVQALADAMAYEVEQGRCDRVERGVYRAVGQSVDLPLPAEPLTWDDPDPVEPRVDPSVADDPERWSASRWPTSGCDARSFSAERGVSDADADADAGAGTEAGEREVVPGEDLDRMITLARRRVADLVERQIRASQRADSEEPAASGTFPHVPTFEAHWRRFAVDSVPRVERWLAKGEGSARRRSEGEGRSGGEGGDDGGQVP